MESPEGPIRPIARQTPGTVVPPVHGPVWPSTFQASFHEVIYLEDGTLWSENEGLWYYDFANRRARFDHLKGQKNNFCGDQVGDLSQF